jgi:hypothetical protein
MLYQKGWTPTCSDDDYQIESSTDVVRLKHVATDADTNCVMVSDELFLKSYLLPGLHRLPFQ